jgi:hypothetical protein
LNLLSPRNFKYTLRFKATTASSWIWIRDQNHTGDGQIIFRQPTAEASVAFDFLFSDSDSRLEVKPVDCRVKGVDLFGVSSTVPARKDQWNSITVGRPLSLEHFYALVCAIVQDWTWN